MKLIAFTSNVLRSVKMFGICALFNLEGTGKDVPKEDVEAKYGPIAQLARAHD